MKTPLSNIQSDINTEAGQAPKATEATISASILPVMKSRPRIVANRAARWHRRANH